MILLGLALEIGRRTATYGTIWVRPKCAFESFWSILGRLRQELLPQLADRLHSARRKEPIRRTHLGARPVQRQLKVVRRRYAVSPKRPLWREQAPRAQAFLPFGPHGLGEMTAIENEIDERFFEAGEFSDFLLGCVALVHMAGPGVRPLDPTLVGASLEK